MMSIGIAVAIIITTLNIEKYLAIVTRFFEGLHFVLLSHLFNSFYPLSMHL